MNLVGRFIDKALRAAHLVQLRQLAGVSLGTHVLLYGRPIVSLNEDSVLLIGNRVVLCSDSRRTALALAHPIKFATVRPGAVIEIGDDTGVSGGTFVAAKSIKIGREVLLGANVTIVDTDFHPLAAKGRRHSDDWGSIGVEEVTIGDNVFVGMNCIILKGSVVGSSSVIAAGSVVRGTFGDHVILAGNPARVVGDVPRE